jgi:hypothetical protein
VEHYYFQERKSRTTEGQERSMRTLHSAGSDHVHTIFCEMPTWRFFSSIAIQKLLCRDPEHVTFFLSCVMSPHAVRNGCVAETPASRIFHFPSPIFLFCATSTLEVSVLFSATVRPSVVVASLYHAGSRSSHSRMTLAFCPVRFPILSVLFSSFCQRYIEL